MSAATTVPMTSPVIENNNENEKPMSMLVMSGGEGYIDFRVGKHFVFCFIFGVRFILFLLNNRLGKFLI